MHFYIIKKISTHFQKPVCRKKVKYANTQYTTKKAQLISILWLISGPVPRYAK